MTENSTAGSQTGEWVDIKITLQPDVFEAIQELRTGEFAGLSTPHAIIRILAERFGLQPILRVRGNPKGRPRKAKGQ